MAKAVINLQKESGGIVKISPVDGTGVTEVTVPESGNLVSVDTAVTDNAVARFDGTTGKLQNSGVIIDDNGNVGIGVSSPLKPLQVKEIGFTYTDNITCHHSIKAGLAMEFRSQATGTLGNNVFSWISLAEKELFIVKHSGDLLLTSGTGRIGYGAGAGGTVTQLTSKGTAVTLNKPSGYIYTHDSALADGQEVTFTVYNNLIGTYDNVFISPSHFSEPYNIKVKQQLGQFNITIKNISGITKSDTIQFNFAIIKGSNN